MYVWWRRKYDTSFQNLLLLGLIGGTNDSEGNVFIDGRPVCDDHWSYEDAKVACRQFGFDDALEATTCKNIKF